MSNTANQQEPSVPSERVRRSHTTLEVEIFGESYSVRSDRNVEQLTQLAALVDRKMQEIAGQTSAVETSRIAILAALNIADELARERERKASSIVPVAKQANGLLDQLEDVLSSPME